MNKRKNNIDPKDQILTDIDGLCALTCLGAHSADELARKANCRVKVGKRVLYVVEDFKSYISDRVVDRDDELL